MQEHEQLLDDFLGTTNNLTPELPGPLTNQHSHVTGVRNRVRVTAGCCCGLANLLLHLIEMLRLPTENMDEEMECREPAISLPADKVEHALAMSSEPDRDAARRFWLKSGLVNREVLSQVGEPRLAP